MVAKVYGLQRRSIAPAIRELVSLGLIEVMERGCAGNAEFRRPNTFRLTYRPAHDAKGDGTHEYRSIKTMAQAGELASQARSDAGRLAGTGLAAMAEPAIDPFANGVNLFRAPVDPFANGAIPFGRQGNTSGGSGQSTIDMLQGALNRAGASGSASPPPGTASSAGRSSGQATIDLLQAALALSKPKEQRARRDEDAFGTPERDSRCT